MIFAVLLICEISFSSSGKIYTDMKKSNKNIFPHLEYFKIPLR